MRRWRQVVRHGAAAVLVATAVPAYAGSGPAPAPAPLPDVTAAVGAGAWFEPNVGQDSPEVRYRARVGGALVRFTDGAVQLSLRAPAGPLRQQVTHHRRGVVDVRVAGARPRSAAVVAVRFLGGAAHRIEGVGRTPTRINYLRGDDPARWQAGVPTYDAVRYRGLWPGIDLRYDSPRGRLKGTYTVAPGADADRIRLGYAGARVAVAPSGELLVTPGVPGVPRLVEHRPVAWQDVAGGRRPVAVRWRVRSDGTVGFAVGHYDRETPLVIDPEVEWSRLFNHLGQGMLGTSIAVDRAGDVVTAGVAEDPEFHGNGVQPSWGGGQSDGWVAKLTADGSRVVWFTYLGGAGIDWITGIEVDRSGRVAFTGYTDSADFPTRRPIQRRQSNPAEHVWDVFAGVLQPDGRSFVFSTYLSSPGNELGADIHLGRDGTLTVAGGTFPRSREDMRRMLPTPGAYTTAVRETFVARLTGAGRLLWRSVFGVHKLTDPAEWSKGHSDVFFIEGMALAPSGEVTVATYTDSPHAPVTKGAYQDEQQGWFDFHVTRLSADGRRLRWATYLGSTRDDEVEDVTLGRDGSVYLVGSTYSPAFPAAQDVSPCSGDAPNIAIAKLDPTGRAVRYGHCLGGSLEDRGGAITVDASGRAVVLGYAASPDFPWVRPFQDFATYDEVVIGLARDGTISYASPLGGHMEEYGTLQCKADVVVDGRGGVVIAAGTASPDFPGAGPPPDQMWLPPKGAAYVSHIAHAA